ncbi:hypothetical protein LJR045_001003 [Microbacterium sp. LjRoot45]|uniref:hypothetical protein n=1 Tax=Microbacterium sp. LjRoot45 TaxID=3342329 RepID=UPI003ED039A7
MEFAAAIAFDEDTVFDVAGELGHYGAVMSVSPDFTTGSALLTVEAGSALDASTKASELVVDALASHQVTGDVVSLRAQREDAFEAELNTPIFPEVVGYAEIAELAGVTRQRARQFAQVSGFPVPVIETAQGPLMAKAAVERWLEKRAARPGRPRKAAVA